MALQGEMRARIKRRYQGADFSKGPILDRTEVSAARVVHLAAIGLIVFESERTDMIVKGAHSGVPPYCNPLPRLVTCSVAQDKYCLSASSSLPQAYLFTLDSATSRSYLPDLYTRLISIRSAVDVMRIHSKSQH